MKRLIIIAAIFINACSDDSEPKPGYIEWSSAPDSPSCEWSDCGPYPELMRCGDGGGSFPSDIRCTFASGKCRWIIFSCYETGSP
jgi:hypothetical protein